MTEHGDGSAQAVAHDGTDGGDGSGGVDDGVHGHGGGVHGGGVDGTAGDPAAAEALRRELAAWPVGSAAAAVVTPDGVLAAAGSPGSALRATYPWASVTKLLTAFTTLTVVGLDALDEPAGPPGSTLRHLLAHASGLSLRGATSSTEPGVRRRYSNRGYEVLSAELVHRTREPFADTVARVLLEPLRMTGVDLGDSAGAAGASGTIGDLATLARELLAPAVLDPALVEAASTVTFPGLAGDLPGYGAQDPNDWGLGPEIRSHKAPHWTSERNSPRTFGHFGQSGSFLWVDPDAAVACVTLADQAFGPWAVDVWPGLSTLALDLAAAR